MSRDRLIEPGQSVRDVYDGCDVPIDMLAIVEREAVDAAKTLRDLVTNHPA